MTTMSDRVQELRNSHVRYLNATSASCRQRAVAEFPLSVVSTCQALSKLIEVSQFVSLNGETQDLMDSLERDIRCAFEKYFGHPMVAEEVAPERDLREEELMKRYLGLK